MSILKHGCHNLAYWYYLLALDLNGVVMWCHSHARRLDSGIMWEIDVISSMTMFSKNWSPSKNISPKIQEHSSFFLFGVFLWKQPGNPPWAEWAKFKIFLDNFVQSYSNHSETLMPKLKLWFTLHESFYPLALTWFLCHRRWSWSTWLQFIVDIFPFGLENSDLLTDFTATHHIRTVHFTYLVLNFC